MWLFKRSLNKSLLGFRVNPSLQDEVGSLLDASNVAYVRKKKKQMLTTVDKEMVERNAELFASSLPT
jgi:hypothetical protein